MHEGYGSLFVCLSVCSQSTDFLRGLYNKINIPDDFTLISKGFQLRDFSKRLLVKSFSFNCSFDSAKSAILSSRDRKQQSKWRTLHTLCLVELELAIAI